MTSQAAKEIGNLIIPMVGIILTRALSTVPAAYALDAAVAAAMSLGAFIGGAGGPSVPRSHFSMIQTAMIAGLKQGLKARQEMPGIENELLAGAGWADPAVAAKIADSPVLTMGETNNFVRRDVSKVGSQTIEQLIAQVDHFEAVALAERDQEELAAANAALKGDTVNA